MCKPGLSENLAYIIQFLKKFSKILFSSIVNKLNKLVWQSGYLSVCK